MGTRLFVGGLSWGTDDGALRAAFEGFGEVTDARVVLDRETGRSRGFGFVGFATEDQAQAALAAMEGAEVDGRRIRVNIAEERGGGGGAPRGPRRSGGPPAMVERRPRGPRSDGPRPPRSFDRGPSGPPGGGYGGPPGGGFGGPPPFPPPGGEDGFEGKPGASRRRGKDKKKKKERDPWGGDQVSTGRGRRNRGRDDWRDWSDED